MEATSDCVNCSTDIRAEFGDIRPLGEARMHALKVNRVQLLDLIDIGPDHAFITELANAGCITWSQRDHIADTDRKSVV